MCWLMFVMFVMLCYVISYCVYKCMLLIFPWFWFVCSVQFFIDLKYFNSESFALVAFHASGHYNNNNYYLLHFVFISLAMSSSTLPSSSSTLPSSSPSSSSSSYTPSSSTPSCPPRPPLPLTAFSLFSFFYYY